MKFLSSFTHPQVVPYLYEFLSSTSKDDILKNVGMCAASYWLPLIGQKDQSLGTRNCLVTYILQNIILCSAEERNAYRFGITWEKWWQNLNFWVNYSFNPIVIGFRRDKDSKGTIIFFQNCIRVSDCAIASDLLLFCWNDLIHLTPAKQHMYPEKVHLQLHLKVNF